MSRKQTWILLRIIPLVLVFWLVLVTVLHSGLVFPRSDPPPSSSFHQQLGSTSTPPRRLNAETNGPESAAWAPVVFSTCEPWMSPTSAPCQAKVLGPQVVVGEEVVFDDFEIREPVFLNSTYRNLWIAKVTSPTADFHGRMHFLHNGFARYTAQVGQTYVIDKGVYRGIPRADKLAGLLQPAHTGRSALFAASPDSWSFQHFLDRTTHLVIQASEHLDDSTDMIVGRISREPAVVEMWDRAFGVNRSRLVTGTYATDRLVWSCQSVLVHPYFELRFAELMGVARNQPMKRRKKVLYLSRNTSTRNGGRRIVNEEDELLPRLRELLKTRRQREELVVFDHSKIGSMKSIVEYFADVRAIVGPHGSAFHIHRWAPKDTLVVEFVPSDRFQILWWEESHQLGQIYAPFVLESLNSTSHDMRAPANDIATFLDANLGKTNVGPILRHYK
ncbi:hypothetical protein BDK51DRAFT_34374 [Blyttiomyces helicus]|uniref:Glycosyltransferase 61 catalytic domain-containing protein n=1 Tax=Blyttiomyces helicus TaxID=388810 RepID=A0A4P9WGJ3_9FUNG|nr:hypothetical protein BDK51DRAFT_34374 [Blyttiomyces helicus]|eukprot:RKO91931.1 hypothetical protein BDK51DRAFT_34374 [Blyttiomyces helicus]